MTDVGRGENDIVALSSDDIRLRFLQFFAHRGHTIVPSAPLVPDDQTLLFTNAGMVPFKDAFLGVEDRSYTRATSAQRCMRVSGKHNDLENVGPSPRHHTFFEMLGNFSFGDYFKAEAIRFAQDFLVEDLGVDSERLVYTVFQDDEDARRIWLEDIGVVGERVLPMGEKTNFWMMADVGPCGPTSEIHYDFGATACTCGRDDCSVALDNGCERWLEIWNLVFMQYDQDVTGQRRPLPRTGVDTGMGLERITAVVQHAAANYDTDLFRPIMDHIQRLAEHDEAERSANETGYRVLADHGRAMASLIADGVLPGNEGRGYVLRLIMRRAMRFGRLIGFEGPFLTAVLEAIIERMSAAHQVLAERRAWIVDVVAEEETRFARTLSAGLEILDQRIAELATSGEDQVPGADVFRLYDTFGFPPDLTKIVAAERGFGIDRAGFEVAMEAQRTRARAGGRFEVDASAEHYRRLDLPATTFVGYDTSDSEATILAMVVSGSPTDRAETGTAVEIVLDKTPFYPEGGGQVGDSGIMRTAHALVRVTDTTRPVAGLIVHHGVVDEGVVSVNEAITAQIDDERRDATMRNHTATHLLHDALQSVLGEHAQQRGSLVAPDRLRFDFAHLKALTDDELEQVEQLVNQSIRANRPVAALETSMMEAQRMGATMLFGEKYGDDVRVVEVESVSRELCGGTHVSATGQIGSFLLTSESSIGSGLRRVEAVTGRAAEDEARARGRRLAEVTQALGVPSHDRIVARLKEVLVERRELRRELDEARTRLAVAGVAALTEQAVLVEGVPVIAAVVEAADAEALRQQVGVASDRLGIGVVTLGAIVDDKPRIVAAVPQALVSRGLHAGRLVQALAIHLDGGGGGKPTLAEAGGKDPNGLAMAIAAAAEAVAGQLAASAR